MRTIVIGHRYELDSFDGGPRQVVQFIHKVKAKDGVSLETLSDGTTNEEVLRVLIDRMGFLNAVHPCPENEEVIECLENALTALNRRTAARKARGVEGKHVT